MGGSDEHGISYAQLTVALEASWRVHMSECIINNIGICKLWSLLLFFFYVYLCMRVRKKFPSSLRAVYCISFSLGENPLIRVDGKKDPKIGKCCTVAGSFDSYSFKSLYKYFKPITLYRKQYTSRGGNNTQYEIDGELTCARSLIARGCVILFESNEKIK